MKLQQCPAERCQCKNVYFVEMSTIIDLSVKNGNSAVFVVLFINRNDGRCDVCWVAGGSAIF
jgi:hypothetical protein